MVSYREILGNGTSVLFYLGIFSEKTSRLTGAAGGHSQYVATRRFVSRLSRRNRFTIRAAFDFEPQASR